MILLVKSVILPTTSLEKFEIPVVIEAANSDPGRFGRILPVPGMRGLAVLVLGPAVWVVL